METIIKESILYSDYIAIADDRDRKITYKELARRTKKLKSCMEERSLIFILCDRQMETVEFLYEILYLNLVPLLLDDEIDGGLLDNLLALYRPQYIYGRKSRDIHGGYVIKTEWDQHVLLKTGNFPYEIHRDVAVLMSTSGTTGSAKLVKLSYGNLRSNAEQVSGCMDIRPGQKGLHSSSFGHVYGLAFYIWHWYCGATILITGEPMLSSKFGEFYTREKVNNLGSTPYGYQILRRIGFWTPARLEYLHWAMSGGAPMPESEQKNMVSYMGDKFWIGYGMTETASALSCINLKRENGKWGSVGRPLKDVRIVADSGTGELIVKSRSVCMGYAENSRQLADGDRNHGILHTGDVVEIDEDGYIYLKGRIKRYVNMLGKRVSLDEVEAYLKNQYTGMEFACVGEENHITVFCAGKEKGLERYVPVLLDRVMKMPARLISCIALEKLPRSSSGKTAYDRLTRELE